MNHEAHEGSTTKDTKSPKGMEKLGSYNILDQLPTSGAGDVFRARDTVHGRTVLIRLMPPRVAEDAQLRERLIADARAAAILSHPNIQALFEIGEDGPHLFLVFEFIPGQTLRKVIGGRPLNVRNAIDIAAQLADALAEAHAQGFVHGDIKPENIRMNAKGQAKILEFGLTGWMTPSLASRPHLSELAGPHARSRLLLEASLDSSGAPPPLGPQALTRSSQQPQALSQPPAPDLGRPIPDSRSPAPDSDQDLASLGAVVYEMLTGRPPSAKPGAPSTLNRDVPRELDAIVLRAITGKPDQRYRSGAALSAELRSVAAILDIRSGDREPPTRVAQPVPAPRRTAFRRGPQRGSRVGVGRHPQRGSRVGRWLAVIVLLAVVGGALWWSLSDRLSSLWQRWVGPVPDPVVLVAPLEVAAPQRQYWSGGLAHDLAMRLGQIPGLTVVGRTGFGARREGDPARRTLRPQALLTGALDFQDGRVLLDVELLDLRDRRALWTERYASETSAILATQTEMAEEVARALRLSLEPSPARARKKSHRVSEGSYELYLRGRDRAAAGDAAGALEFYEQAAGDGEAFAELDAAYADALYQALSEGGPGDPLGAQARLRETATRAAAADPDLPQAALAQAMASASFEESAHGAVEEFDRRPAERITRLNWLRCRRSEVALAARSACRKTVPLPRTLSPPRRSAGYPSAGQGRKHRPGSSGVTDRAVT